MKAEVRSHRITICILLSLLLATVQCATYTVNNEAIDSDMSLRDGRCLTKNGFCTLQAAIDEANSGPSLDTVVIPEGTFRTDSQSGGLTIRDDIIIAGKSATSTILTGMKKARHFNIPNEKLLIGLGSTNQIGALRPSNGRRLNNIVSKRDIPFIAGSILTRGDEMFVSYFTEGVAKYTRRSVSQLSFGNQDTFSLDKIVVNDNGNGAGLTAPTTIEFTKNGDLLVNSFQPSNFGVRRYDGRTYEYKGIFINPPGNINSMTRFGDLIYATLVDRNEIHAYDAGNGTLVKSSRGSLSTPRGITICSGRIFVASEKNDRVVEFDRDLKFIGTLIDRNDLLDTPQGLACLFNGDLFVKTKSRKLLHYHIVERDAKFIGDITPEGTSVGAIATIVEGDFADGPKVTFRDMTLQEGNARTGVTGPSVRVSTGSNVEMNGLVLQKNRGSIYGGAIYNAGSLNIFGCRIIGNTMPEGSLNGGGRTNSGGAIGNFGNLLISRSEIANNQAARGGGLWNGGVNSRAIIESSTISDNYAGNAGGGIFNFGSVEIKYSTITENRCQEFSRDHPDQRSGCGFFTFRTRRAPGFIRISSSIIAGNKQITLSGNKFAPDCLAVTGTVDSVGGNIIGEIDPDACKVSGSTTLDKIGSKDSPVIPGISSLRFLRVTNAASSASFTRGHEPLFGRMATTFNPFGQGGNPKDACPSTDQIGRSRPQGTVCDVGAIERKA